MHPIRIEELSAWQHAELDRAYEALDQHWSSDAG